MKAKELAEILLARPDAEVEIVVENIPGLGTLHGALIEDAEPDWRVPESIVIIRAVAP